MKTLKVIVLVKGTSEEVSRTGNSYLKLSIKPIVVLSADISLNISKHLESRPLTMLRIDSKSNRILFGDTLIPENVLILTLKEITYGVTTYIDSKGIERIHGQEQIDAGKYSVGDVQYDIVESEQCTEYDLVEAELEEKYIPAKDVLMKFIDRAKVNIQVLANMRRTSLQVSED